MKLSWGRVRHPSFQGSIPFSILTHLVVHFFFHLGFGWIVIALILLLVGSAFQFVEGKAVEQEEADKGAFNDEQSTRRIQESNHIKLFQKG